MEMMDSVIHEKSVWTWKQCHFWWFYQFITIWTCKSIFINL